MLKRSRPISLQPTSGRYEHSGLHVKSAHTDVWKHFLKRLSDSHFLSYQTLSHLRDHAGTSRPAIPITPPVKLLLCVFFNLCTFMITSFHYVIPFTFLTLFKKWTGEA